MDKQDMRGAIPAQSNTSMRKTRVNRRGKNASTSRIHAMGLDPVQQRYITQQEDHATGMYRRVVIKPIATTFVLNRLGGAYLDVIAASTKTPYPHVDSLNNNKSWVPANGHRTPQVHKLGGTQPKFMTQQTINSAAVYATTMAQVRGKLSELFTTRDE